MDPEVLMSTEQRAGPGPVTALVTGTVTAKSFARAFGERCPNCKAEVASGGEAASGPDDGGVLRCPGCGVELQLAVALEEPRIGLWVASVVGLALGAGFDVLALAFILARWLLDPEAFRPTAREIWMPFAVPGALMCSILGLLILRQRWFRERNLGTRLAMAAFSFVLSGLTAGWFLWCKQ